MAFSYISVSFLVKTFSIFSFGLVKKKIIVQPKYAVYSYYQLRKPCRLRVRTPARAALLDKIYAAGTAWLWDFPPSIACAVTGLRNLFFFIYIDHHSAKKKIPTFQKHVPISEKDFFFHLSSLILIFILFYFLKGIFLSCIKEKEISWHIMSHV